MPQVSARFLPVSHLYHSHRTPGLNAPWTESCDRCDRQCEHSASRDLSVCSYGVNFQRVSEQVLLFGFLIRNTVRTQAQQKAHQKNPHSLISEQLIVTTVKLLREEQQSFSDDRERVLAEVRSEYVSKAMYSGDILLLLQPELKKALSFLHDYRQFVSRVSQNINVVLQKRYPGRSLDDQLQQGLKEEAALYWSSKLMEDKLTTSLMLTQPEALRAMPRANFRLHGLIHKHVRIYESAFADKGVRITEIGRSTGEILASEAFAVIPHTLLDNALKYSSRGGEVKVMYLEDERSIKVSVVSYGPRIQPEEQLGIFELFKRGAAAVAHEEEGSGIGLYLAQLVAREHGTLILVQQSTSRRSYGHETTFTVELQRSDRYSG